METENFDHRCMVMAYRIALEAHDRGDYPIGVVLTLDNKKIVQTSSKINTHHDWFSHAELIALSEKSKEIRSAVERGSKLQLYSTLEPCLMCYGAAVMHRVSKIMYVCPDPCAGFTYLLEPMENPWFQKRKPEIIKSDFGEVTQELIWELMLSFFRKHGKNEILNDFLRFKTEGLF